MYQLNFSILCRQSANVCRPPRVFRVDAGSAGGGYCCQLHIISYYEISYFYNRRKFRSQTSDNMDKWKAEMGRVREQKRREEERSSKRESLRRKKIQAREKVGNSRSTFFSSVFPMICGSGGSKSRRAKAAGAEPAGQMRDEKLHARCGAKHSCPTEKAINTRHASDHFWKLRCRKSSRRCGAKHISKSKCTKHTRSRTTFGSWDVEKVHVVVARSTFWSKNVKSTSASEHFQKLRCRKSARCCGAKHISKSKSKNWGVRTTFWRSDVV